MTVHHGDSLLVLPTLDAESVDAIVCDPPYGLSFMGKEWDHGVPGPAFWREALRVAKPGAHLLAFGGARTYHRLACAIEDAGWEIRDCLAWMYGSGFPKSLDVSKAMDKAAGAEREVVGEKLRPDGKSVLSARGGDESRGEGWDRPWRNDPAAVARNGMETAPATDLARQWHGWGTALKPAYEPIILARKPLIGTVAANVARYGTGAVNVDGCRIGTEMRPVMVRTNTIVSPNAMAGASTGATSSGEHTNLGRWPANVLLDEDAAAMLDEQSGERGSFLKRNHSGKDGGWPGGERTVTTYGDTGGASRFFYTSKASRREREAGLEGMPEVNPFEREGPSANFERMGSKSGPRTNAHPTVKPIAVMRWLCRLVTPPNGLILDPFTGSGTTGCAAVLEGFRFVGIEREAEYVEIARKRIAHWAGQRETKEPDLFTPEAA